MARYSVPEAQPGVEEPSEDYMKALKETIRGCAKEKKAKVSKFKAEKNSLEFSITPDQAGEDIMSLLNDATGIRAIVISNPFESFASKYGLKPNGPQK